MRVDIERESLQRALEAASLRELPRQLRDGQEGWWLRALVLVGKAGGSRSWCLAERRRDGFMRYVRDFGLMRPILKVLSVHPYIYLDRERFGLQWRSEAAERKYLVKFFGHEADGDDVVPEVEAADRDGLDAWDRERIIRLMRQVSDGHGTASDAVLTEERQAAERDEKAAEREMGDIIREKVAGAVLGRVMEGKEEKREET